MKLFKMTVVAAVVAVAGMAAAFADDSGLRRGTAYTVQDDAYYFMNVIDWKRLDFDRTFVFTRIGPDPDATTINQDTANIGDASHLPNGSVLAVAWDGNLWAADPKNLYRAFYGINNMAFLFQLNTQSVEDTSVEIQEGVTLNMDESLVAPALEFGINITDKVALEAAFGIIIDALVGTSADVNVVATRTEPLFDVYGHFTLVDDDTTRVRIKAGYSGDVRSVTVVGIGDDDAAVYASSGSSHNINATVTMQHDITPNITYGASLYFPLVFGGTKNDSTSTFDFTTGFTVRNGLSARFLNDRLTANIGLQVDVPYMTVTTTTITYDGNSTTYDPVTTKTKFFTTFYAGLGLNFTENIRLDASAQFDPVNRDDTEGTVAGMSLSDIWETGFNLSLSLKF